MTQEELKALLHYDSITGIFTWIVSGKKRKIGTRAGHVQKLHGYRVIGINYQIYREHRLAWLYVHGYLPDEQIDHRDGDKTNNKLDNLREATNLQNHQNRKCQTNNSSGFVGVHLHKQTNKWRSKINVNGKAKHLGLFNTAEEAHSAYLKAKSELHTFNPIPR